MGSRVITSPGLIVRFEYCTSSKLQEISVIMFSSSHPPGSPVDRPSPTKSVPLPPSASTKYSSQPVRRMSPFTTDPVRSDLVTPSPASPTFKPAPFHSSLSRFPPLTRRIPTSTVRENSVEHWKNLRRGDGTSSRTDTTNSNVPRQTTVRQLHVLPRTRTTTTRSDTGNNSTTRKRSTTRVTTTVASITSDQQGPPSVITTVRSPPVTPASVDANDDDVSLMSEMFENATSDETSTQSSMIIPKCPRDFGTFPDWIYSNFQGSINLPRDSTKFIVKDLLGLDSRDALQQFVETAPVDIMQHIGTAQYTMYRYPLIELYIICSCVLARTDTSTQQPWKYVDYLESRAESRLLLETKSYLPSYDLLRTDDMSEKTPDETSPIYTETSAFVSRHKKSVPDRNHRARTHSTYVPTEPRMVHSTGSYTSLGKRGVLQVGETIAIPMDSPVAGKKIVGETICMTLGMIGLQMT